MLRGNINVMGVLSAIRYHGQLLLELRGRQEVVVSVVNGSLGLYECIVQSLLGLVSI